MKIKRKTILFILLTFVIVGVLLWYFLFLNKGEKQKIIEETKDLFPFGQVDTVGKNGKDDIQGTIGENENTQVSEDPNDTQKPVVTAGPRLRQISNFPTGGFAPITRSEEKEVTDIVIDSSGQSSQVVQTVEVENPYVRYSSIKEANVYETRLTPSSLKQELLVENFIPNAEYTYFNKSGDHVLFQYWNNDEHVPETYLAELRKIELEVDKCPYDFNFGVKLGDDNKNVFGLHEFLNKNPRTQVAVSGINAPGAESSLVVEPTITAIKNFQSLYKLDIDGRLGPATSKKMLEICDKYMLKKAKEEFEALETKYKISGSFLPQNVVSLTINPAGSKFFYLMKNSKGITGLVRDFNSEKDNSIFESPYGEWIGQWNSDNTIELSTKPSYLSSGYSYTMNATNGDYHKSLAQKNGLMTLASPNNKKILIVESLDSGIRMSIFYRNANRTLPLSTQTFVDKCTWGSDSKYLYCAVPNSLSYGKEYPDTWYQGLETYTDSLWRIDSNTLEESLVSDFGLEFDADLDVERIGIDSNSDYLYFIDKKTEFLWSYRLHDA